MSTSALPPIEAVTGGSHGVEAGYEQMLGLAARYEQHAGDLVDMAGLGARVVTDGDLLESAVLAPVSFADAEVRVLGATAGTDGLAVRAVGIEADALGVRAVVAAFRASDALSRHAAETLDHTLGRVVLTGAVTALPALLVAGGVGHAYWSSLTPEEQEVLEARLTVELGALLHEHPALAQHLLNSGGGLVGSLVPGLGLLDPGDGPVGQPTTNDAARLMALLLGDDTDYSVAHVDVEGGARAVRPGSLQALVEQLAAANDLDAAPHAAGLHGAIQVQQVGEERYIVYLPGTDDMQPLPSGGLVRDMETNYQLIGGTDSAYGRGIRAAMLDAGLDGKGVMLVGHSQGGMVATSLAADPDFSRHFDVQHVVTAGSPTAQVAQLPESTHALHLENRGDAVPLLDGEDNPDQPRRTTVLFDDGTHRIADNHGLDRYAAGAAAAEASGHGSVRDLVTRMHEDGYLGDGPSGPVRTYVISR